MGDTVKFSDFCKGRSNPNSCSHLARYDIGSKALPQKYSRNQFFICEDTFISQEEVTDVIVSLYECRHQLLVVKDLIDATARENLTTKCKYKRNVLVCNANVVIFSNKQKLV